LSSGFSLGDGLLTVLLQGVALPQACFEDRKCCSANGQCSQG